MLSRSRLTALVLLTALVVGFTACSAGAAQAPSAPVPTAVVDAAAGAALFVSAGCADCHAAAVDAAVPEGGTNLAGFWAGNGIYDGILGNFKPINDENVKTYLREGGVGKVGKMPAHPELTDEQLQQLVDYLKTLDA
jgi:mono/diheme cytochrome c family protein